MNTRLKSNNNRKYTAIPVWIYIILIASSISFIILSKYISGSCVQLSAILENFGYGIFGSSIVACLIDFANTKNDYMKNVGKADELFSQYRTSFLEMRDSVLEVAELRGLSDGKKRTFNEWISYAFGVNTDNDTNDEYWEDIWPLVYSIEKIIYTSRSLDAVLINHLDNTVITTEDRRNVRHINCVAKLVCNYFEEEMYEKAFCTLTKELIPSFLRYNDAYSKWFKDPYSVDHWCCD